MIDLLLRASTKAGLITWLKTPPHDLLGANNRPRDGVSLFMWNDGALDEGRIVTANRVVDANGDVVTPETYLPGRVAILRFYGARFLEDRLTPDPLDPDKAEQWARSKFARYIHNNGTPGTRGPVQYYALNGGELYRFLDVITYLAANGLPGHTLGDSNLI